MNDSATRAALVRQSRPECTLTPPIPPCTGEAGVGLEGAGLDARPLLFPGRPAGRPRPLPGREGEDAHRVPDGTFCGTPSGTGSPKSGRPSAVQPNFWMCGARFGVHFIPAAELAW